MIIQLGRRSMTYGVTSNMIDTFGELVFELSLNKQRRVGDPIRRMDWAQIEAQREGRGLSDAEIGDKVGLTTDQARYIRVVMERRTFRRDQYRKLFQLGGGKRYRDDDYAATVPAEPGAAAMDLREALSFEPAQTKKFVTEGYWTNETLSSILAAHAKERPEAIAIQQGERQIIYGELQATVLRLAGSLQGLGIGPGDMVSVQLPNVAEYIIAYLAACHLGAVMSTIHMPYRAAEFRTLLEHSQAKAVICLPAFKEYPTGQEMLQLQGELTTLEHVICMGDGPGGTHPLTELMSAEQTAKVAAPPVGADPMLLLYTSGTSSSPKGVPLTYQNMLSNTRVGLAEHSIGPDDSLLSAAPFSHLYGIYSIHLALAAGATALLLPVFTPPDLANVVEQEQPSMLFTSPAHISACLNLGVFENRDLSSLRQTIMSGSACPPELFPAFQALTLNNALAQLWGMTECQAGLYTRPNDSAEVAAHSAGRPSPGNEARIVDSNGAALSSSEEGELHIRGCSVFPGYYNNEAANQQAFSPDGWFRTGDLAKMDEAGNISITGRTKDIINRGGVKFNPVDVELLIDKHPAVMQSAIVPMADPVLGERACAFVVPMPNQEAPSLDALCTYLLEQGIAKNKLPEKLVEIDEMPLTPTRKIIKGKLEIPS